jgi:hypothetical protein
MEIHTTCAFILADTFSASIWRNASFAADWYEDALEEARAGGTFKKNVRREIIFAVCAAESYLFEWVRDRVLSRDFAKVENFFPPGEKRPVQDRWKDVLKQLEQDRLITKSPSFDTQVWGDFTTLVRYRHDIVHANVSRPSHDEHDSFHVVPGWATNVVFELISNLHEAVGTPPPKWLVKNSDSKKESKD